MLDVPQLVQTINFFPYFIVSIEIYKLVLENLTKGPNGNRTAAMSGKLQLIN